MRRKDQILAILCSDIHLSLKAPAARAGEPDWLAAQKRVADQLHLLQREQDLFPPILCGGDVFDKWNSPVEIVNWAVEHWPLMYAIPGNHDLPYHSLDLVRRSAFWTLCLQTGPDNGIFPLWEGREGLLIDLPNFVVQGFPFGVELTPAPKTKKIKVAVIHHYVWIKGHSYPGAPKSSQARSLFKDGMGWDVIMVGDNHKGFLTKTKAGTTIFNCGGLQRRKTDEVDYHPQVGLLRPDGSVDPYFLDISEDIITSSPAVKEREEVEVQLEDFLEQLQGLQGDKLDFQAAIYHAMDDREVSVEVRKILLEAME